MKNLVFVSSEQDLNHMAKEILSSLNTVKIVLLQGDLASGKTTLVQAFVKALNIDEKVSSPTFSILHEYGTEVCHYDIYQKGVAGFLQSGLLEKLEEDRYHFIEWADEKLVSYLEKLQMDYARIKILPKTGQREYKVDICTH